MNKHGKYTKLIIDESLERFRIHIAPVGFEVDRIVLPAEKMKADRVWLIVHNNPEEDAGQPFSKLITESLKERRIELKSEGCRSNGLVRYIEGVEEEVNNAIFINVSSGSKIQSIVSMMACMIFKHHGQLPLFLSLDHLDIAIPDNERLDGFLRSRRRISQSLSRINTIENKNIKVFLLCAFSNILKGCSRWMMKSVKPTIDRNKVPDDAYKNFYLQVQRMIIKNEELWKMQSTIKIDCVVDNVDANNMRITDHSASLIVTSPPYVTSYEYADLHQLSAIWLGYADKLSQFRSKFIGSIHKHFSGELFSKLAQKIVAELREIDKREANGVEHYFFEMQLCFEEMRRVLKRGGRASIVIGDMDLKRVRIHNAEVFVETMENVGFEVYQIVKRPIPSKILPLTRDQKTGRFISTLKSDRMAYPFEYILTMEKI